MENSLLDSNLTEENYDDYIEKIFDEFSKFVKSDSLNILKSNIRLVDKLYFLLKSINKDNVFNYLNNEIKSEITREGTL